ncbi:MAG: hypothetical protein M1820_001177 [Bogoriella megaspora]|nr:MAG: hypothetical protein M1820_001177 [Bogoriella megaspora]
MASPNHESMNKKSKRPRKEHPITGALSRWLNELPDNIFTASRTAKDELIKAFPKSYTIYPPMLLLPHTTFTTTPWKSLMPHLQPSHLTSLYTYLLLQFSTTHLAINAPIPLHIPLSIPNTPNTPNTLRSPTSLHPLSGAFGPPPSATYSPPTTFDFSSALWVSSRQNGIYQTWAPLHTMFSRGNVSEKARILSLPSVARAVNEGRDRGKGSAAVDLYVGIGYFAFSYVKAGVRVVLGWEISGWSVEGLRRGAEGNGWGCVVVKDGTGDAGGEVHWGKDTRLVVFQESNEFAMKTVRGMRERLPPIRHVNCGLLPSAKGSWQTALEVLDPDMGGWLHSHQNIAIKEMDERAREILSEIQSLADALFGTADKRHLVLEHVEQVKTYAPGVMHCVLDILVPPKPLLMRS